MALILYQWLLLSILSFSAGKDKGEAHPFYVSVTEINHNAKEKSLEVTCKIFADDMEAVLKQNYKVAVDLTNAGQQQHDHYISDYIKKHLLLTADGKAIALQYVGYEKDSESVYCYFEVPSLAALKRLDMVNSILQDFTPEQINIIHATANGKRQSTKLDYPNKQASFTF